MGLVRCRKLLGGSQKAFGYLGIIVTAGWSIYPLGYYYGYLGSSQREGPECRVQCCWFCRQDRLRARSRKGCGFFAWAAGDRITHTNCAVYSLLGGCKDDDAFQGYKAYMISTPLVESRLTSRQCDIYKGVAGRTLGGESHSVVMALDFTDSKANAHQRQWILNIGQMDTGGRALAVQTGKWNSPFRRVERPTDQSC